MAAPEPARSPTTAHQWWSRRPESSAGSTEDPAVACRALRDARDAGLLDLPLPGHGATRSRWESLSTWGELDLTLGRLVEAHADAVAILAELGAPPVGDGDTWGVWAAEPPQAPVAATATDTGWRLEGTKPWCSGAGIYTHALVTATAPDGGRLFAVDLRQPAVNPVGERWASDALLGSDTRDVVLHGAVATAVGGPGDYLARPGFWHGAVGVAAVWYGGAVAVARALVTAAERRAPDDVALVHLGAVDAALGAANAALCCAADQIDAAADTSDAVARAAVLARRTRAVVEAAATTVLDRAARALGAPPLATDRLHARRVADLQLYLRQSHADRDLADLGRRLLDLGPRW